MAISMNQPNVKDRLDVTLTREELRALCSTIPEDRNTLDLRLMNFRERQGSGWLDIQTHFPKTTDPKW